MAEMEQSLRIVETAMEQMPGGPGLVNPETGRPIPAAEMVDLAKMGDIYSISGGSAVTCPTLEGSGDAQHASIAADENWSIKHQQRENDTAV